APIEEEIRKPAASACLGPLRCDSGGCVPAPAGPSELAALYLAVEIGIAANTLVVNEDLRHGTASLGALQHLAIALLVVGHVDFLIVQAQLLQELLGRAAIAAPVLRVDLDLAHASSA